MPEKPTWQDIERARDEPVDIPLDPEEALRALLKVDPESEPTSDEGKSARRRTLDSPERNDE